MIFTDRQTDRQTDRAEVGKSEEGRVKREERRVG